MKIKVGVSNHHVHLTKEALEVLFGKDYVLTRKRDLLQKGQYACEETVTLKKNDKLIEHVRIIGPCRNYTQVELLDRDNEYFGINAPTRKSGVLDNSETLIIVGPKGEYIAKNMVIVSNTHIHMSAEDLVAFNKSNDEIVKVKTDSGLIIENVHIKSDETCVLEMHINKDIAEKLGLETGNEVEIC